MAETKQTEDNTQITGSDNTRRLLNDIPKDALEVVKSFVQEVKKPLFFTVRVDEDYNVLKITMYKQEFKIDLCTEDLEIDTINTGTSYPIYFKTKKALAIYLHNYCDGDTEYNFGDETSTYISVSLNNEITCHTKLLLVDIEYKERKTIIRETIEDYADLILDGHN